MYQPAPLRLIGKLERFLPPLPAAPTEGRRQTRGERLALVSVGVMPAIVVLATRWSELRAAAPVARPVLLDMLVLVGIATAVAAMLFGLRTWFPARRAA